MLKENNNIDKIFNNSLYNYGKDMPSYTWDILEADLLKKKKKKKIAFYLSIAGSVILIVTFISGFLLNEYINKNPQYKKLSNHSISNIKRQTVKKTTQNHFNYKIKKEKKHKINAVNKYANNKKVSKIIENNALNTNTNIFIKTNNYSIDNKTDSILLSNTVINKSLIKDQILNVSDKDIMPDNDYIKQNTDNVILADNTSNWDIGGGLFPVFSDINYNNSINREIINSINSSFYGNYDDDNSNGQSNYTNFTFFIGLNTRYKLSNKLSVQSGLNYMIPIENYMKGGEIPILLNYKILNKNLRLFTKTGFSCCISWVENDINSVFNFVSGIEARYKLNQNLSINLGPTFKYELPFFNENSIYYNIKHVGIYTGISYYFEK